MDTNDTAPTQTVPRSDPRRSTTRVISRRLATGMAPVSGFVAWPAASSLMFLLSAAFLLSGAWAVFASVGNERELLGERFGMVGTVHAYELALVLVAWLLSRWQRANPDAIGPVVLGACFLVGSAVTLDLVSIDAPWLTLALGVAGLAFSIGKAWVLTVIDRGGRLALAAAALLAAWNLLWPAAMGLHQHFAVDGQGAWRWWLPGWLLVLAVTLSAVTGIVRDDVLSLERARPFLRRRALRWTLVLIVAAGSGLHLEVLGYLHSIELGLGDFLPLIAVLGLGAVDLRHRAYGPVRGLDPLLLTVPPVLALITVLMGSSGLMSDPRQIAVAITPSVVMAAYAVAVWWLGERRQQRSWRWVAGAAAASAALTWQAAPGIGGLDWLLVVVALSLAALLAAWRLRRVDLLVAGLLIAVGALMTRPELVEWQHRQHLHPLGSLLAAQALVFLAVAGVLPASFRKDVVRGMLWLATITILDACGRPGSAWHAPLYTGAVLVAVHAAMAWRTRDLLAFMPLLVPALIASPALIPQHKGWLAVWGAFALLAAGATVSWCRINLVRRGQAR